MSKSARENFLLNVLISKAGEKQLFAIKRKRGKGKNKVRKQLVRKDIVIQPMTVYFVYYLATSNLPPRTTETFRSICHSKAASHSPPAPSPLRLTTRNVHA